MPSGVKKTQASINANPQLQVQGDAEVSGQLI